MCCCVVTLWLGGLPRLHQNLSKTIQRDVLWLSSFEIMDYSLLLGIHRIGKDVDNGANAEEVRTSTEDLRANTAANAVTRRPPRKGGKVPRSRRHSFSNLVDQISQSEDDTVDEDGQPMVSSDPSLIQTPSSSPRAMVEQLARDKEHGGILARMQERMDDGSVQEVDVLLFIGIIDILIPFGTKKYLEHRWKRLVHDGDTVSVHKPNFYRGRFEDFMTRTIFNPHPATVPLDDSSAMSPRRKLSPDNVAQRIKGKGQQNPYFASQQRPDEKEGGDDQGRAAPSNQRRRSSTEGFVSLSRKNSLVKYQQLEVPDNVDSDASHSGADVEDDAGNTDAGSESTTPNPDLDPAPYSESSFTATSPIPISRLPSPEDSPYSPQDRQRPELQRNASNISNVSSASVIITKLTLDGNETTETISSKARTNRQAGAADLGTVDERASADLNTTENDELPMSPPHSVHNSPVASPRTSLLISPRGSPLPDMNEGYGADDDGYLAVGSPANFSDDEAKNVGNMRLTPTLTLGEPAAGGTGSTAGGAVPAHSTPNAKLPPVNSQNAQLRQAPPQQPLPAIGSSDAHQAGQQAGQDLAGNTPRHVAAKATPPTNAPSNVDPPKSNIPTAAAAAAADDSASVKAKIDAERRLRKARNLEKKELEKKEAGSRLPRAVKQQPEASMAAQGAVGTTSIPANLAVTLQSPRADTPSTPIIMPASNLVRHPPTLAPVPLWPVDSRVCLPRPRHFLPRTPTPLTKHTNTHALPHPIC